MSVWNAAIVPLGGEPVSLTDFMLTHQEELVEEQSTEQLMAAGEAIGGIRLDCSNS